MDTAELNNALKGRMEELVSMLFPNAKIRGHTAFIGGIDGSAGESLQIHISGSRIGCFIDHANPSDKGGTPLFLWSKAKNISFADAVKEAKEWLGIKDDHASVRKYRSKTYAQPDIRGKNIKIVESNTPAMDYLVMERMLDPMVLIKNKVADAFEGKTIVFPYFEMGNEKAVHVKYLNVERDAEGKKKMWSSDGTKRCLFGKLAIDDNVREIVITEGEIDALSYQSVGIPAVSVPNGVSDQEWIELDWEWLERFEKVYISTDMDGPGREAAEKIARRIGLHRTFIVSLPHKDANDCLKEKMTRDSFLECLIKATQIDLEDIKSASAFSDQVWELYDAKAGNSGYSTPWSDLPFRIRPGEFTVVSGYSGHGKTQMLNHLIVHLASLGAKIFDASLEIKPAKTLHMMSRAALAKKAPDNKQELQDCINWMSESMWFYDHIGVAKKDKLLEAMNYARKRFGIDIFVIDSLFKCGVSGEDFNGQRNFMDELTAFANDTGAHVILVAHSRKSENEDRVPTKTDISGSQDINNAAFNVLIVWRNKLKQRRRDEAIQKGDPIKVAEIDGWYDGKIRLDKQRFGEGEDKDVSTYFDHASWQFQLTQHTRHAYYAQGRTGS
jgi:twinkle protein